MSSTVAAGVLQDASNTTLIQSFQTPLVYDQVVCQKPLFLRQLTYFQVLCEKDTNANDEYTINLLCRRMHPHGKSDLETIRINPSSAEDVNDLDVTGSPLKYSFRLSESFDEGSSLKDGVYREQFQKSKYEPLSEQDARILLSPRFCVGDMPYWAFCDGRSNQSIILLGRHQYRKELCTLHSGRFFGIISSGFSDGTKQMQELVENHRLSFASNYFRGQYETSKSVEINYKSRAIYYMGLEDATTLTLNVSWFSIIRCFLEPPSAIDALVQLEAKVLPGCCPKLDKLWSELLLLAAFIGGLANHGVAWRKRTETDNGCIKTDVFKMMNQAKLLRPRNVTNSDSVTNSDEGDGDFRTYSFRKDVDFIDLLWSVLHRVESYAELCEAWTYILKLVHQEEIRPYMDCRNKTKVVALLQKIAQNSSSDEIPMMKGSLPLVLLVEIGIEKLKRDYIHAFISCDWARGCDLNFLLTEEISDELILKYLVKTHYTLELVESLRNYIFPENECLRIITAKGLAHDGFPCFASDDLYPLQIKAEHISLPIKIGYVRSRFLQLKPILWQCSLYSEWRNLSLQTSCLLTTDPPVDFVLPKNDTNFEGDVLSPHSDDTSYFKTILSSVTRQMA